MDHRVDRLVAGPRCRGDGEETRGGGVGRRLLQRHAKEAAPPAAQAAPAPRMTIGVVAGSHIGVRGGEVAVEHRHRKARPSVVDVDIGPAPIERDRDLDRRRAALLPVVRRVALVVDGVVSAPLELAGSHHHVHRAFRQTPVHPELTIARRVLHRAAHGVHVLDEIEPVAQTRARRVREGGRHQRVRHGFEGRLHRRPDDGVVEVRRGHLLPGDCREPVDPVVDEPLPTAVELAVGPAEPGLRRILSGDQQQRERADSQDLRRHLRRVLQTRIHARPQRFRACLAAVPRPVGTGSAGDRPRHLAGVHESPTPRRQETYGGRRRLLWHGLC